MRSNVFIEFMVSWVILAAFCPHVGTFLLWPETHTQTNKADAMPEVHYCHIHCHTAHRILHFFTMALSSG